MVKISQEHEDTLSEIQQRNIDVMLIHNIIARLQDQLTTIEKGALDRIIEYVGYDADDQLNMWYEEIEEQEEKEINNEEKETNNS